MVDSETRRELHRLRGLGYHVTSRVRCAARFAALTRCSITEAAAVFGLHPGGVWAAWARIYPMRPQPLKPQRAIHCCANCGSPGHAAVDGRCSRSARALRLVARGETQREAAAAVGITPGAVHLALKRQLARAA